MLFKFENTKSPRICVLGAGALGSAVLSQLKEMQLEWVDVVDMDIVEIGNLGYQLLFDKDDVGKYKADVTLFKLFGPNYKERHTAHLCRVQEVPRDVLLSYDILLGCFDNLEARFYVNQLVMSNSTSNTTPIRPLYIDGGSMGLGGQAQLIIPTITPCFHCLSSLFPDASAEMYPLCTIVSHPTLPEHCITFVQQIVWPQQRPHLPLDQEDDAHIRWITEQAKERAMKYQIEGVDELLVKRVLNNGIITHPSTNSKIASFMLLFLTRIISHAELQSNYIVYRGDEGEYNEEFWMEKDENCPYCGTNDMQTSVDEKEIRLKKSSSFEELHMIITNTYGPYSSIWTGMTPLYAIKPEALRTRTECNRSKTLDELGLYDGDELIIHTISPSSSKTPLKRTLRLL